jgi:hypothetical protein
MSMLIGPLVAKPVQAVTRNVSAIFRSALIL